MNKDIAELKDSIEFTDAKLIEKQKNIEKLENKYKEIKNINEILKKNTTSLDTMNEKLVDLENRSRRNNLRIDGVKENEKESWSESEEKVKRIFMEKLNIKDKK